LFESSGELRLICQIAVPAEDEMVNCFSGLFC
jgi:hypothetical protein